MDKKTLEDNFGYMIENNILYFILYDISLSNFKECCVKRNNIYLVSKNSEKFRLRTLNTVSEHFEKEIQIFNIFEEDVNIFQLDKRKEKSIKVLKK